MKNMKSLKNMNVKKLFRRNQIIITALAIMIAAAGYLNYAGKKELTQSTANEAGMMEVTDNDILSENQMAGSTDLKEIASLDDPSEGNDPVSSDQAQPSESLAMADAGQQADTGQQVDAGQQADAAQQAGESQASIDNPGEAVLTSGMSVSDYIANVQLSREQVRAKNKETLMGIINNTNIEEAAKQQAIQNMVSLTEIAEKENSAETLLMAKGFSDPVVSITDGKVDVVINAASITDPQRAQIEDIVKRKTEVGADNIIITLLKLSE